MSKKIMIVLVVLIVIAAGMGGGYYLMVLRSPNKETSAGNFTLPVPSGLLSGEKNEVYKDSSGFSFSYPADVKVTDMTPDNYYSLLTLAKRQEAIKITVKDGGSRDIIFSGAQLVGATTLAGISAKQYKSGNSLITAALDSGIVYLIEGPADGGYWEKAQNTIVSSFALSSATSAGSGTQESVDDVTVEEEVVQ